MLYVRRGLRRCWVARFALAEIRELSESTFSRWAAPGSRTCAPELPPQGFRTRAGVPIAARMTFSEVNFHDMLVAGGVGLAVLLVVGRLLLRG